MTVLSVRARLLEQLKDHWTDLPDKPHETPESTLEALLAVAEATKRPIGELILQRMNGTPLAHLSGTERFMGIELETSAAAMIPRKETEILAKAALRRLQQLAESVPQVSLFDLCTGSGNLALALAHYEPKCVAWGSDIAPTAIQLARKNSRRLGLSERVTFWEGDFLDPFREHPLFGHVDMLVCNPPYISTGKVDSLTREIIGFEPREAFDGGPMGVSFLLRLCREAHQAVRPGGWLGCEVGAGQGEALGRMFSRTAQYDQVESFTDDQGRTRAILARKACH
ncbi:MAG: modification methylase, HemK family [Holophagaceae bacterium]|nr:modification methylase, HemK family [Holophagaceae bacterium]